MRDLREMRVMPILGIMSRKENALPHHADLDAAPAQVPAAEFARNFGHYRVQAQGGAVAVTSHGRVAGYFIAPHEYAEYEKLKARRQSFATEELDDATVERIARTRMHRRHRHLDAMLKDE